MKLGKSSQNTENLLVDTVLSVDLEPHGPLDVGLIVLYRKMRRSVSTQLVKRQTNTLSLFKVIVHEKLLKIV